MRPRSPYSRLFIAAATLILLVAAFLRLWMLHTYPPGPHYDEAVYLLVSRTVAFNGARPFPILEAYQGREVLYLYLNWLPLTLIHDGIFTLHLVNALCGMVIVAASMALGRLMFPGRRGVIIGLAMGAAAAISFPQIWLARQAFRAVTLPLMQSLALVVLWRGLNGRRHFGWLIVGGFLAGAALYTYDSSRLFPLWLALGGLVLLIADRKQWRTRLPQGIAFYGALIVTALPMAIYAVQRPDIFFNRLGEVTQSGQSVTLAQSIVLHLKMFFIQGDPYVRYNIPGRPYFTLPEGVLLLIGLAAAGYGLFRARRPVEKMAYALALLSPLMVIPSVISVGGLPPSNMRSLGMIPLIFVLVGVGYERVSSWLARRSHNPPVPTALVILLPLFLIGSVSVGVEYFQWASRADVYYETDADLAAAADWVRDHREPTDLIYVAAKDRPHPTFEVANLPDVTYIGTDSLFFPPPGRTGLVIFPRSAPPPADWLAWMQSYAIDGLPLGPDGRTAFQAFRIPADLPLPTLTAPPAEVHNQALTLLGMADAAAPSGDTVTLDMGWQVDAPAPADDLTPIVQLEDAHGFVLARVTPYITQTDRWRTGEVYFQHVDVQIPSGTPPGSYPVRVAWVARASDHYQTYTNADGIPAGLFTQIGSLTVTRPAASPDPASIPLDVRVDQAIGAGMRLLGWNNLPETRRPGESIPLTLTWQATDPAGAARPDSWSVALGGVNAASGAFDPPIDQWQTGDVFTQRLQITLPRDQAAGALPVTLQVGAAQIALGTVQIVGEAQLFDQPPVDHLMDARFGDVIRLVGYSLHTDAAGEHLQLVWQALRPMNEDYTVFVHLLDSNGQIIVQQDAMPHANQYPTSLWETGEYISDSYEFPPLSFAALRWGLYLQSNGVRLQVTLQSTSIPSDSITVSGG